MGPGQTPSLKNGSVATRLPAQDLERARRFYSDTLGLDASEERPGGLLYKPAGGAFALFESSGASSGEFTQIGWDIDDIEATVAELKARGLAFERDEIVEISDNYPSKGTGELGIGFRDSEGNLHGLAQPIPRPKSLASAPDRKGLSTGRVATRLPTQNLERARRFYAEKLGLKPSEERPGGLLYEPADGAFALFESSGASSGEFTQMGWDVDDIESAVAELEERGVVFEAIDLPGLKTVGGIAEVAGNYPSKGGKGERAAWFRDSENNMLGIGQPVR
jgi:catechol 2,3-dioxygenase-like lactoylglutathione lyase family enzyme